MPPGPGGSGGRWLERAKEGRESLTLHVYRENSPAVRFYQREGFAIRAAEREENTGREEYHMEWHRGGQHLPPRRGSLDPLRPRCPGSRYVAPLDTGVRDGKMGKSWHGTGGELMAEELFGGQDVGATPSYKEQAYRLIKEAILFNRFRVGAIYSQDDICKELGISRTRCGRLCWSSRRTAMSPSPGQGGAGGAGV